MKWLISILICTSFSISHSFVLSQESKALSFYGNLDRFNESNPYDVRSRLNNILLDFDSSVNQKNFKSYFDLKIIHGTSAIKHSISQFEYALKGSQILLSGGFYWRYKNLTFSLSPVIQSAEKKYFNTFSINQNPFATDRYYNLFVNWIDSEDFYSQSKTLRLFPGMSFISYDINKIKLKFSTESIKWGPGNMHNLIMSDNNPGFLHLSIESKKRLLSNSIGLDFQVLSGLLNTFHSSNVDTNYTINGNRLFRTKSQSNRIINAVNVSIAPKFLKGIVLGFNRSSIEYTNNSNGKLNLEQFIPRFKKMLPYEDTIQRDQYASLFFKLNFDSANFELYGELGRNDFSYNLRDFILSPLHSGAFMFGASKKVISKKSQDVFIIEFVTTKLTLSSLFRDEPMWYSHYQVRQGYTNYQKLLGDYVGGGSQAISMKWNRFTSKFYLSLSYDRIINNIDMAKYMFGDNAKNWITNSLLLSYRPLYKKSFPTIQLGLTHHKNYQWNSNNNVSEQENLLVPYVSYSIHF